MSVDVLEERLRQALRDGETSLTADPGLAVVTAARGRNVLRRRRITTAGVIGAVAAVVAAGALVVPRHAPTGPPVTGDDDTPASVRPGRWVTSLTAGEPPRTAYVAGTTVHVSGHVVRLDGYAEVAPVGQSVVGTVLLGRRTGGSVAYLAVGSDGGVRVLATGPAGGVRGAAVSPDGRYLAHGGDVMDLTTLTDVARLPQAAAAVSGWIPSGVVYLDEGQHEWLWAPGGQPQALDRPVWFPGPTSAGIGLSGACPQVMLVDGPDDVSESARRCAAGDVLTVSPDGRWLVTKRLLVVAAGDGSSRWLAGGPLTSPNASSEGTAWEDDTHLLVSVPTAGTAAVDGVETVVRCDVVTGACERATGPLRTSGSHTVALTPLR